MSDSYIDWHKDNGQPITTVGNDATVKYCESMGWTRADDAEAKAAAKAAKKAAKAKAKADTKAAAKAKAEEDAAKSE